MPYNKTSAHWVGPRRVIQALYNFTFKVEHILTRGTEDIHISRIMHYTDSRVGPKLEMKKVAEHTDHVRYSVDKIKDVRKDQV